MEPGNIIHRQTVRRFMDFQKQPVTLAAADLEEVGTLLEQLYETFGNLDWIVQWFQCTLNAYWITTETPAEVSSKLEPLIGDFQMRLIPARQFQRTPACAIKHIVREPATNTSLSWRYPQPYPPDIEAMREPHRTFFRLVDQWLQELRARQDPQDAMMLMGGFVAGLCLTYPTYYLDQDPFFQRYLHVEVGGTPTDDDYTFWLSKTLFYVIFDRQ